MSKKLITAALAVVALAAFALPATASAANKPGITHPTGTLLNPATGSCTGVAGTICLKATNVGTTFLKNEAGTATLTECTSATMTGYLVKNSGGTVEGTIHTATFSGTGGAYTGMNECTGVGILPNLTVTTNGGGVDGENVTSGTPYCIRSTPEMAENEFQVRGGACTEAARKITFIFDTTGLGECKYERATAISGTFTTETGTTQDAVFHVKPAGSKFTGEAGNNVFCPAAGSLEMSFTMETDTGPEAAPVYISKLP